MKKLLAIIFSLLFFVTLSFAVSGCKKKEEPKPEEAVTEMPEMPAPAPAPEAAPVPEAPPAPEAPTTP